MGTGRYPAGGSHEAADQPSEETTVISDDGEWQVAEQYRVDPPSEPPDDRDGTVVIAQNVPPQPVEGPVRKFPPDISSGLLAALLGVLLAVILVPTGLWLASNLDDDEPSATNTVDTGNEQPPAPGSARRTVANVVGRQLDEARRVLREARLNARVRRIDSERPAGLVLAQEPRAGAKLGVGAVVVLTVSGGTQTAPTIEVPDVEGLAASEAIELLENAGFETETRPVPSDQPEDTVVAQAPAAGEEADEGATVVLDVAAPREADPPPTTTTEAAPTVRVPSVVGTRSSEARSRLQGLGLRVTQQPAQSSRPAGEVVGQLPGAGREVREGSLVTLRVSTGPPTVAVPDVVDMTELDAIAELEGAGFVVQVVDEPTLEPTEDGIVLRQSPRGGQNRREGTSVTITVARFS